MKANLIIIIFLVSCYAIYSQPMDCGVTGSGGVAPRSGCDDWSEYANIDLSKTPVKRIRLTLHVFQKDDGTGNFSPYDGNGNPTADYWHLKGVVEHAGSRFSNLEPMQMPTTSPYLDDSRIRVSFANIYVWKDSTLWDNSNYRNGSQIGEMYSYIQNQNIQYKNSSLHILIPGKAFDMKEAGSAYLGNPNLLVISNWKAILD